VSGVAGASEDSRGIAGAGANGQPSQPTDMRAGSRGWLAVLRVLLLPIVFAGNRLVAHPTVGTAGFDLIFLIACIYAVIALIESRRRGGHPPLWVFASLDLALVCALTYESGGAFSQLHWAFVFLPLGAAILLDPRRTALISAVAALSYMVVALTHPATHSPQLDLVLVQALYIAWVSVAAVVLSTLLARRRARIVALAAERGSLVAQALAAEDRARQRLADGLHDAAIQNLLAARQDLAEARSGEHAAIDRAERAVRLTLDQLRATVRELHPYVLEQLGLEPALETVADQQAHRGGYAVRMQIDADAVGVCDQLIFSLARELLANVSRHAHAAHVSLALSSAARAITLTISDDGCGVEDGQLASSLRRGHIGLASCRERVSAVGGRFEIRSRAGGGTTVRCLIPRQDRDAALYLPQHSRSSEGALGVALGN
jgi:two-component system, NarL family, sensor kinase